jgi:hypothetical protein
LNFAGGAIAIWSPTAWAQVRVLVYDVSNGDFRGTARDFFSGWLLVEA